MNDIKLPELPPIHTEKVLYVTDEAWQTLIQYVSKQTEYINKLEEYVKAIDNTVNLNSNNIQTLAKALEGVYNET